MLQPPYFEDATYPKYVCRMKKSLYGLRQASRVWNRRFSAFLLKHALVATAQDPCFYIYTIKPIILLAIFVDDGLLASTDSTLFTLFCMK